MPLDDYTPTVRGGLKLKGSTPTGIAKKKKKSKSSKPKDKTSSDSTSTDLQKALEEEDASLTQELTSKPKDKELDETRLEQRGGDGKTASERAYEEMRRKRVCIFPSIHQTQRERERERE
jgi:protein FAM32A